MNNDEFQSIVRSLGLQAGGLIEIYVIAADHHQWRSVVEWLHHSDLILSVDSHADFDVFRIDRNTFSADGDIRATMFCKVGRQKWWTSFYSPDCIDFQGDPNCVETAADLMDVVSFMKGISRAARTSTLLIPETSQPEKAKPYIRVAATGEVA